MKNNIKALISIMLLSGLSLLGQTNDVSYLRSQKISTEVKPSFVQLEPRIINNAGPEFQAQALKMKKIITQYNQLVYEKKLKEATRIVELYFPKSEIEYISSKGHSIISEYHINIDQSVQEIPKVVPKKVTKIFENETDELYILTYENNTQVETTWSHPFFIINKGWTEAKDIKVGDYSQTTNGKLKITKINIEKLDKPIKVYNFEVEDNHNYFVSKDGILVHNQNKGIYGRPTKEELLTSSGGGGGGGGPGLGIAIAQGVKSLYLTAGYYYGQASSAISNQINRFFSRGGSSIVGESNAIIAEKGYIDPQKVRFVQDSIKSEFKDGKKLKDAVDALKNGKMKVDEFPPIRIFNQDGKIYSLDNRRLEVFKQAGVSKIPYQRATEQELTKELPYKFTTTNDGISIKIRDSK